MTDPSDETTEEEQVRRGPVTRRSGAAAGDEPTRPVRTRPRPEPDIGPDMEPEPEPAVKPGSLSRTLGHVALTVLALAVLYTAWQHTRRTENEPSEQARESAQDTVAEEDAEVSTTLADPGVPVDPECPPESGVSQPVREFSGPPPMCIDDGVRYVATVRTNRGEIRIDLDATTAPRAVNNFVFLARWRFYEGASFHRVEPGFLMDTGDPIGRPSPGYGGPGYTVEVEPAPTGERPYPVLSVTTVKTPEGTTNGSQFSIVTGDQAESGSELPAELRPTVFGRVTGGEDVVTRIDATGDELTGTPVEVTVIEEITIEERGGR